MAIIPQSFYETYLTGAISASDTTIPVATCPASGVTSGFVQIEGEIIKFEGNSNPGAAGNLTSCTRGLALSGTTETDAGLGVAHAAGKSVKMSDVHYYLNNAAAATALVTTGTITANDIPRFTDATTMEGLSYAELKAALNLEIGTDVLAQQTIGIADNNLVEIDDADATDNDYAKFTAAGLEGRNYTEVKTDLSLNNVENTALSTWAGSGNITAVGTLISGNVDAAVSAANLTTAGKIEVATAAETTTGTDATRAVSPDGLAGSNFGIRYIQIVAIDYATDVTTGDGKAYVHIPAGLNGMNLVEVHAEVITAGTTNSTTVQIHNVTQAADMLSALLEIETGETASDTSDPGPTIDTNNDDVATNDLLRIDVDTVSTTAPQGLIVTMGFQLP